MVSIDTITPVSAASNEAAGVDEPQTGKTETNAAKEKREKVSAAGLPVATNMEAASPTTSVHGEWTGKQKAAAFGPTKADIVLRKLRSVKGVTIAQLVEATSWQAHSVRGFLSGTVRKKLGLKLLSEIGKDGVRRYRINDSAKREGSG